MAGAPSGVVVDVTEATFPQAVIEQSATVPVVLDLWASWCGPCRRELPMLGHVQKLVGREYLEVIAINMKEPRSDYLGVLRANKDLDLTFVHDVRGVVTDRYGVTALPNMFIIGQDGRIRHAFVNVDYSERAEPQALIEAASH